MIRKLLSQSKESAKNGLDLQIIFAFFDSREVEKPIISGEMNGRCQVDLIDYQSRPDGEYKFVLVYQDHFTKYVLLRALKNKKMETIVDKLFPIFIDFGAPILLHSDNGREFCNQVREMFSFVLKYSPFTSLHREFKLL